MNVVISKDTLWKGILEDFVNEFIQFFFPELSEKVDWNRKIIALDKELEQLNPQSDSKIRYADKLFRVFLTNGKEQWLLIHVEAHGYQDPNLPMRMFQSYYRLQDRYAKPVVALVIYTYSNKASHYAEYRNNEFGMELLYRFHTFSLIDHPPQRLQSAENIFAIILEAAWYNLHYQKETDEDRLTQKADLTRRLLKSGYPKEKLKRLINFVKYYVAFKEPKYLIKFEKEILKEREPMGITESIIQEVKEQGLEQGSIQQATITIKNLALRGVQASEIAAIIDMELPKVEAILKTVQSESETQAET